MDKQNNLLSLLVGKVYIILRMAHKEQLAQFWLQVIFCYLMFSVGERRACS